MPMCAGCWKTVRMSELTSFGWVYYKGKFCCPIHKPKEYEEAK